MQNIRGLILDMDGVLWRAHQPLGDLPTLFARLDALGIRSVFVTNNATRSVAQYVEKLRSLGVEVTEDRILNSALAAAHALQEALSPGEEVYVLGEEGLAITLKNAGF
ncbi:MAG: haloacid dehalogenase, partial [Chloroflexi bacterium]|nr:haloacid dehalogenase [Chloroflexota bacterium]